MLAGLTVTSQEVSERFLRDYYKTLGDCFRDNFYGTAAGLCHAAGLKWHSESGGPWNRKLAAFEHADQLAFLARNDMPQGEFWHAGSDAMNRPPAMTAHIYGKRLAATEAFTHMRTHWSAYPAVLKPDADAAFFDGVNHFIWHTFTCSPPEFGKPGIEYFAGTHLNPERHLVPAGRRFPGLSRPLPDHAAAGAVRRRRLLLHRRQDLHALGPRREMVGESLARARQRIRLRPGERRSLAGSHVRARTASLSCPTVCPIASWPSIWRTKRFRRRLSARSSNLPRQGPRSCSARAVRPVLPGLHDYPNCDATVRQLADELWSSARSQSLGQGKVVAGRAIDDVLQSEGILPDFEGSYAVHPPTTR